MIDIKIPNAGNFPVFFHRPQAYLPQEAYLAFDPAAETLLLTADFKHFPSTDSPLAVWPGRIVRIVISPYTTRRSLEALATNAELASLLTLIHDGCSGKRKDDRLCGRNAGYMNWRSEVQSLLGQVLVNGDMGYCRDWYTELAIEEVIAFDSIAAYAHACLAIADADGICMIDGYAMEDHIAQLVAQAFNTLCQSASHRAGSTFQALNDLLVAYELTSPCKQLH